MGIFKDSFQAAKGFFGAVKVSGGIAADEMGGAVRNMNGRNKERALGVIDAAIDVPGHLRDGAVAVGHGIGTAASAVGNGIGSAATFGLGAAVMAGQGVAHGVQRVGQGIDNTLDKADAKLDAVAERIDNGITNTANRVSSRIDQAQQQHQTNKAQRHEMYQDFASDVKIGAKMARDDVLDAGRAVGRGASAVANGLGDAALMGLGAGVLAAKATKHGVERVGDALDTAAIKADQKIGDAVSAVGDKAKEAGTAIHGKATEAKEAVQGKVQDAQKAAHDGFTKAKTGLNQAAFTVGATVDIVSGRVEKGIHNAADKVHDKADDAKKAGKEAAHRASDVGRALGNGAKTALAGIRSALNGSGVDGCKHVHGGPQAGSTPGGGSGQAQGNHR